MTLKERLNRAEELYHTKGKNFEAINLYKEILAEYPEQSNAWFNLASLEFQIANFDGCFKCYFNAQKIEPNNKWFHHMYTTWLSLVSSFDFEEPYFFDYNTKEAHTIKTFKDKNEVLKVLIEELKKSLEHKNTGDQDYFNTLKSLAMKNRNLGKNDESVQYYKKALDYIPKKFNEPRIERQRRLIYLNIAIAYKNERKWEDAKENILLAKKLGLDDFHNELVEEILRNVK